MRVPTFALLFALSLAPVQAEQLTVRNHPLTGRVTGTGSSFSASLPDLAEALRWDLRENHGRTSVLKVGAAPDAGTEPGVWVNGTHVEAVSENGELLVNVAEFARAAGLSYAIKGDIVELGVARASGATLPTVAFDGKPIELNQNSPGADVDLNALAVRGKMTFVFVYSPDIRTDNYVHLPYRIDSVAKNPKIVLYKLNAGSASSAFSQHYHYPATSPELLIFTPSGNYFSMLLGHSIQGDLIDHPDEFIDRQFQTFKIPGLRTTRFGDPVLPHF
jgi:hypothetical protein